MEQRVWREGFAGIRAITGCYKSSLGCCTALVQRPIVVDWAVGSGFCMYVYFHIVMCVYIERDIDIEVLGSSVEVFRVFFTCRGCQW